MKKYLLMVIGCLLVCILTYRFCDLQMAKGSETIQMMLYENIHAFFVPEVVNSNQTAGQLVYMELEQVIFPVFSGSRKEGIQGKPRWRHLVLVRQSRHYREYRQFWAAHDRR